VLRENKITILNIRCIIAITAMGFVVTIITIKKIGQLWQL
jgi:hypothetical protein